MMKYQAGRPFPLGSRLTEINGINGVNFALFSQHASGVELCIFCKNRGEIRLPMSKTGDIWHLFVEELNAGTEYGFRVAGKSDEAIGHLFNPEKLLIDPYANAISGSPDLSSEQTAKWFIWNDGRDNAHLAPKSIVINREGFEWGEIISLLCLGKKL